MGPTYEFRYPALPPMAIMPKNVIRKLGPWPNIDALTRQNFPVLILDR